MSLAFVACSVGPAEETPEVSEIPDNPQKPDTLADFVKISATGDSTFLGTNLLAVPNSDRPRMRVDLTYDFWMGRSEVTCGEFNTLSAGLKLACADSLLPAADVTFFDAVLFANAKSKLLGLDTAYK